MNWLIYSAIMYGASVFQYLLVRYLQEKDVDRRLITLMFFAPALPFITLFVIVNKIPLLLSPLNMVIMLLAMFFFSYLGNVFSFKGIKDAPNTGYSLIIQKSYAIYTTILAIFLFNAHLTVTAFLAIIIIILFSGSIMLNKGGDRRVKDGRWILYSFLAFFMFGNLVIFSKYTQLQGISPWTFLFYAALSNTFFNGINILKNKARVKFRLKPAIWIILVAIGLSNGLFNLAMQYAFKTAPNVGYVNIINTASITLITVLSTIFFKDKLNIQKIIGVVGVTLGLILLILLQ